MIEKLFRNTLVFRFLSKVLMSNNVFFLFFFKDGSWKLPLPFDDPLQPLYKGPPLPLCVLQAANLSPSEDGSYESCDPVQMEQACRHMAAWKMAGNHENVSRSSPSEAVSLSTPLYKPPHPHLMLSLF